MDSSFTGTDIDVTLNVTADGVQVPVAKTTFKVFKPRVDSFTASKTTDNPWIEDPNGFITFGKLTLDPATAGMNCTAKVTAPAVGGGKIGIIQTINYKYSYLENDGTNTKDSSDNSYVLDINHTMQTPIQADYTKPVAAGQQAVLQDVDAPGFADNTGEKTIAFTGQFVDYLMFMPDGDGSVWVTLAKNTWSTTFSATNVNGTLVIYDPRAPSTVNPTGSASTELPQWTTNAIKIDQEGKKPDN